MKRREVRQQMTIIRQTAEEWDEAINEALSKMLDDTRKEPTIIRERMDAGRFCAVIEYWKSFEEPESIRDEFVLRGEVYRCDQCPHLRKSTDKRVKWLTCAKGMKGMTQGSEEVCDWYYEQLAKALGGQDD